MSAFNSVKRFWTRSIRRQLMLGIALVHAVLMTIFVFDLVKRQHNFLHQQSIAQTTSLAESLAANSTSWVLANDVIGLEEVIHAQSSYPSLRYAMVVSPRGRVLAHTESGKTGLYLSDPISLKLLDAEPKAHPLVADRATIDIAAPVMANQQLIAWARVGLSQHDITSGLRVVTRDGVFYTLLAIAVGTVFAFFMSRGLTGGLQHLVRVADAVRLGERRLRAGLNREDEVGRLGRDFDQMLDALIENERHLQETQQRLAESEERFELAMRGANDGLWDWDMLTGRVYFSPRWKQMLGYNEDEVGSTLKEWRERIHPEDLACAERDIREHLNGKTPQYENLQRIRHRDGNYRWHLERGIAVRNEQGKPYRLVGTTVDVTDQKRAEEALFHEKERALVTLHSIGDAVITTDEQGRVSYLNPVAEHLTGWSNEEASGLPLEQVFNIINEFTRKAVENPVTRCLREGKVIGLANHTVLINRNGEEVAIEDSAAPIRDRNGQVIGVVMVFHDVSLTRELTRQMTWQATHDALTGLVNRREFERRLNELLTSAKLDESQHTFLYLDLDQFKIVNDTSGHVAGDELLRQLAFLLKEQVRETDTLARLGGDEFGVLLAGCAQEQALKIAEKLRQTIREFRFAWYDTLFEIGVSIGMVAVNADSEGVTTLLSRADMACYAAKDLGRNRIHIYQPDDAELAQRHGEMRWVTRITRALEENRFTLYQQAITPTQDGKGKPQLMEMLVRMVDEEGHIVSPGAFIPAAERYNLMPAIDRWVVEQSFSHIAANPDNDIIAAINLSGTTVSNEAFLGFVRSRLALYGIEPRRICFEITETAAIANLSRVITLMTELKKEGCRFSLDDFGSGLSSFTYLKNLPVDYIKIDGSFVRDLVQDPFDRAMVEAVNQIGQVMGIMTIAEFVENDEILAAIKAIGVDYAQGYGIHKPEPLAPVTAPAA